MDVIAAYREVGSYRGAAAICGTTHKTVKRIIEAARGRRRGAGASGRRGPATTTRSRDLVAEQVAGRSGRISAKRLLPMARAAGYAGSAAELPPAGRRGQARRGGSEPSPAAGGRRCGRRARRWSSTGAIAGRGCTCSARCWPGRGSGSSGSPPTRRRATTLAMLAECFEVLGGVPKVVLADRMGCLKGGVVANVVVPDPGLCPVRHPLPVPARLLRGRRPGVQGDGGEPGRLRQGRPDGPAAAERDPVPVDVDRAAQHRGRGVVRRGQRRDAFGDLRGPRRAAGRRAGAARAVAVAAAGARCEADDRARSTSCPASGSARPATRSRTG